MEAIINTNKRKKIVVFSLLLLTTVGIATFLLATVWYGGNSSGAVGPSSMKKVTPSPAGYNALLANNAILNDRLNAILQLDQQYAKVLAENADQEMLANIDGKIQTQENIFRETIDSLEGISNQDSGMDNLGGKIISSYKLMLENRSAVNSLRNAVGVKSTGLKPGQLGVLKMQNELQEKNSRLLSLEATMKTMSENKKNLTQSAPADTKDNVAALKETIVSQDNKILALTNATSSLKQDNGRLLKDRNENTRSSSSAEATLKSKATTLQQQVDELNAELRMAQVDCNLSRVDAAQIISNSKQRKELLAEASGILTGLARSDDPAIRQKVQYKIIRLNQIAANSRD